MSMTVMEFCVKHGACAAGQKWALSTGEPDMDSLWQRDDIRSEWRIWIAKQPDVLSDRERRQFACWCCRQVWPLLTDERSRQLVVVNELYADGRASNDELAAAKDAARAAFDASWASNYDAASVAAGYSRVATCDAAWYSRVATCDAAWAVLRAAAYSAADAAYDASWAVIRAAASAAAGVAGAEGTAVRSAARIAARDAQAAYLKEHTHPCFC